MYAQGAIRKKKMKQGEELENSGDRQAERVSKINICSMKG